MDDCPDCPPISMGLCWWNDCPYAADYELEDVRIGKARIKGALLAFTPALPLGDVPVCGGHKRTAERLGRVMISEEILEWAVERTQAGSGSAANG